MTMNLIRIPLPMCSLSAAVLLLALFSCSDNQPDVPAVPENTPLTIFAEIDGEGTEVSSTRAAAAASNTYDRSTFVIGDKINVVCTRSGTRLASAGYALGAGGKWAVTDGMALGFLSAITCRAEFPVNYDGIMDNQSSKAAFLKSNLLRTQEVDVKGAEVRFTGDDALMHQHARLTITFEGKNTLPAFQQMKVEGTGLRTGGSATENIRLLRPVANENTYCAVIYPRTAGTRIEVTVADVNNVTYTATLTLASVKPNNNYIYTLTLQNNVLVPVGDEIKPWNVKNQYTGPFLKRYK